MIVIVRREPEDDNQVAIKSHDRAWFVGLVDSLGPAGDEAEATRDGNSN